MGVVLTMVGIVVIGSGLVDMFHTLLHPSGQGRLSRWVLSAVWRISKTTGHRAGSAVGPAAMVTVILCWVLLQGVGWALIYLPHVPGGFVYSSGVNPANYPDFIGALYVSYVTLATLGFGDVVPTAPWIRMAAPFEALTGFALLTAALTWFTQVYPPLSRRRTLALHLKRLADSGYAGEIHALEAPSASRVLEVLAAEVAAVRVDFTQHAEGFYFQEQEQEQDQEQEQEQDPDLSLGRQLPYALRLRDAARGSTDPTVQLGAQQLSLALEQLAAKLKNSFVHTGENPGEVFASYATEHEQNSRP